MTTDDIVRQLDEDRALTYQHAKPAAAVSASMAKAKVLGLLPDKVQVVVRNPYQDMTDEELDFQLKRALSSMRLQEMKPDSPGTS